MAPTAKRYAHTRALLGADLFDKVTDAKLLVVGRVGVSLSFQQHTRIRFAGLEAATGTTIELTRRMGTAELEGSAAS